MKLTSVLGVTVSVCSSAILCASQAELRVQIGHSGTVTSVAFSPDGRYALTGSRDNSARLWDVTTGREIRRLADDSKSFWSKGVMSVAFSPDGHSILTGDADSMTRLWDVASGHELRRFKGHYHGISSVAFSFDGRLALTVSDDYTARLWDVSNGSEKHLFHSESMLIECAALSPDGRLLLTGGGGGDNAAELWDVATGLKIARLVGHSDEITSLAISRDGMTAVTGSMDHTARLWDLRTARELRRFQGHSFGVLSVAFSPDNLRLASTGEDNTVRLWEVATGREIRRFQHGAAPANPVAFSPDGHLLLTGGQTLTPSDYDPQHYDPQQRIARLWDVASGREIRSFQGYVAIPYSIALSPDGHSLLTGNNDASAHLWDLSSGRETRIFHGHSGPVHSVKFSPDGLYAATGSEDHTARLWDVATGRAIRTFLGHKDRVNSLDFAPRGGTLVTASGDRTVRLWDVNTGREIWRPYDLDKANAVAFSPDGCCILAGYDTNWGAVLLDKRKPDGESWNVPHYGSATAVGFSPDGRFALTGAHDQPKLSDAATGRQLREFVAADHGDATPQVTGLAFSHDGKTAFTTNDDATARVWNVATGREIRRFSCPSQSATSVSISPDDRSVFLGCSDGTTRIFDPATGALVATLVSFQNKSWAVVAPDGRFDTNVLDGSAPLYWAVADEPLRPLPLEIFMRQYYTPRLLPRLLARDPLPELPSITTLNRVQPEVQFVKVEADPTKPETLRAVLRVKSRAEGAKTSGAKDLRLFRDGQLVRFQKGDLRDGEYVFDGIPIPHKGPGQKVELTAYAFNTDLVKSETATADPHQVPANWHERQGRAFVLSIGVNRTEADGCDLHYAGADATLMQRMLESRLNTAGYGVEKHLLIADEKQPNGASKAKLQQVLAEIARNATPDDVFILSYSGHGYTTPDGLFYLFPSDLQGSCEKTDRTLTASAISSDELTEWIRPVDAGEMVMILDACYSAASIESADFKPGPMGSRGLGQLAYDKRIRVLAASQATQPAGEAGRFGMGYLSYALLKRGLDRLEADWQPKDGSVWLREWLAYGVEEVPKLYAEAQKDGHQGTHASRGVQFRPNAVALQIPALFDMRAEQDQGLVLQRTR